MMVARIELAPCVMRKEDPTWRFALGASPITEGVVVTAIAEDGTSGYGYGSATPHMGATRDTLMAALHDFAPLVAGRDSLAVEEILQTLDRRYPGCNQAKAAIDCALHDLNARLLGIPLHRLFGDMCRDSVPILRILAIKTPDEMAKAARKLMVKGYRHLKIKLHGEVEEDIARVGAIRSEVGNEVHLTVDANQSYSVDDAVAALTRMAEFGIELAEQPVRADDLLGLKAVTDAVDVAVEADESAASLETVKALVDSRAVDAISLKIPKLGGLRNTMAAARLCKAGGVSYRMGAAVGSRLLSAQAMHLAAVLPDIDYACELGEFDRLLDDPFEGIEIGNGHLALPEGPGSGVSLRSAGKIGARIPSTVE